jgi:DHA1 family tetracycline resistance protein-like MFS transporter
VTKQRGLGVLMLAAFVDQLGFGIVLPILPFYARDLGASGFEVGALLAVYSAATMVFAPLWGRLSDRVGRRPVIIAAAAGASVGFFAMGIGQHLAILLLGRAWLGGFGVGLQTAQAWVADTTPVEERGRAMALLGGVGGLGFVFGPALGAVGALGDIRLPFFIAAGCAALNALLALFLLPATTPTPRTASQRRDLIGLLIAPLLVTFVLTYAFSNIEATFGLFNLDELAFSASQNAAFMMVIGIIAATTQVLGTRWLARRMSDGRRVLLGLGLIGIGSALVPLVANGYQLVGPVALMAMGFAITSPSLAAWTSSRTPADRQGEGLGIMQSVGSLARIGGPGIGGWIYDTFGHAWPFRSAAAVLAAAALGLVIRGDRA